jgi:hypothetical protein
MRIIPNPETLVSQSTELAVEVPPEPTVKEIVEPEIFVIGIFHCAVAPPPPPPPLTPSVVSVFSVLVNVPLAPPAT